MRRLLSRRTGKSWRTSKSTPRWSELTSLLIYKAVVCRANMNKQKIIYHKLWVTNARHRRNDGRDARRIQLSHRTDAIRREKRPKDATARYARPTGRNSVQTHVVGKPLMRYTSFACRKNWTQQTSPRPIDPTPFVPLTPPTPLSVRTLFSRQHGPANDVSLFYKIQ